MTADYSAPANVTVSGWGSLGRDSAASRAGPANFVSQVCEAYAYCYLMIPINADFFCKNCCMMTIITNPLFQLNSVSLPIVDPAVCRRQEVYGEDKISTGMFCAGLLQVDIINISTLYIDIYYLDI